MSTFEERFWAKVEKTDTCWKWTAFVNPEGYARSSGPDNKGALAHRVSYELAIGPIPEGMCVDHICRNRKCVRPDHLRTATYKQNQENLSQLGRSDSSSGFRGVIWDSRAGKWSARVGHNGRKYYVGLFADAEEANRAVIVKRNELFTCNDTDRRIHA